MANMVSLIGRMTDDANLRYTPNGVAVANFTLAVNREFTNANGVREADFIPIVVWQKQAETLAEWTMKGSLVHVNGRIQVRTYNDSKTNERRWMTEIIARNIEFLDNRKKGLAQNGQTDIGDAYEEPYVNGDVANEMGFSVDDIPF